MNNYIKKGRQLKKRKMFKLFLMMLVMLTVAGIGFMLLWNAIVPEVFGLGEITFFKGIGLIILAKILFGGTSPNMNKKSPQPKRVEEPPVDTTDADELYEKWWDEEGEAYFDNYLQKSQESEH